MVAHRILSPARLPIPPYPRTMYCIIFLSKSQLKTVKLVEKLVEEKEKGGTHRLFNLLYNENHAIVAWFIGG